MKAIWYFHNVNLEKTIEESLIMKGYIKPFGNSFQSALDNAKRNQKREMELIEKIKLIHNVIYIQNDTLPELTQEVRNKIDMQ